MNRDQGASHFIHQSWRRTKDIAGWAGPILALFAMPKCPMCIAAYVGLITGTGISIAFAETLRTGVIAASLLIFACWMARKLRRNSDRF